jgi:hypothetical protein
MTPWTALVGTENTYRVRCTKIQVWKRYEYSIHGASGTVLVTPSQLFQAHHSLPAIPNSALDSCTKLENSLPTR